MCFLKAFGTQASVLTEIFFKQALNRYAAGLLLFLFELCALRDRLGKRSVRQKSVSLPPTSTSTVTHLCQFCAPGSDPVHQ